MIYVVNKRNHNPTNRDVYIGRPYPLGNPFSHLSKGTLAEFTVGTRKAAVAHYKDWLIHRLEMEISEAKDEFNRIADMARDGDVYLVCWCAPLACHGNIIKDLLEERAE